MPHLLYWGGILASGRSWRPKESSTLNAGLSERRHCQMKSTLQYERACEGLRDLHPKRSQRVGAGLAAAQQFFREWQRRTAATDNELSRGRWRYKPLDCNPPVDPRLRQIYLNGMRSVSRAALAVFEDESTCVMWFVLAYDKDEQDAAIRRACVLVASIKEKNDA